MSRSDALQRGAVLNVIHGLEPWNKLTSHGIQVAITDTTVETTRLPGGPVRASAVDLAKGLLKHSQNPQALREWARFVHGATGIIELDVDDDEFGEELLDALWKINFGEEPTRDVRDIASAILNRK